MYIKLEVMMTNEKLFDQALAKVESKSIREWANSDHNRPLFVKIAETFVGKDEPVTRFSTYIVCVAIGL